MQELELLESRQLLTIAFDFQYAGAIGSGVGFEDATNGPARRAALEDVGRQFGAQFVNSATIKLGVTSSENSNSSTLASAGSELWNTGTGIFGDIEVVRHKILTAIDLNGPAADGTVDVNWGSDWELSADPSAAADPEFDFYSALLHELTHAVGFSSSIEQNGNSSLGDSPGTASLWTKFDQFLTDVNETPIISSTGVLDGPLWNTTIVGGTSPANGLFFNGTNAKAANGGLPVGLYSPVVFNEGSSGSHLDDDNPAFAGSNMVALREFGPGTRVFSAIEKGILADIGYTLTAPDILVAQTGGSTIVSETGTTDTFTVKLNNAPQSNVVLNVTSGNTAEATVATSPLTFTNWNWNIPQIITVTGVADAVTDGDQITSVSIQVNVGSSAASYSAVAASAVSVTTTDNVKVILDAVSAFPGSQPTLTWQPVAGASRYEMWFSRAFPSASRLYSVTDITTTSWTPPASLAAAYYRYWVRAIDSVGNPMTWSNANTFSVRPTVSSPVTATFDKRPVFTWNAVPFATSYELYLRTKNGNTTVPIPSGTQYTPTSDLPDGDIRWWVRAISGSTALAWSNAANTNVNGRTTMLTPVSPISDTTPTFTWQSVIGAARYILHVENSVKAIVILESTLTAPTFTQTTALPAGNYRAWVRAVTSSNAVSYWSASLDFTITSTEPAAVSDTPVVGLSLLKPQADRAEVIEVVEIPKSPEQNENKTIVAIAEVEAMSDIPQISTEQHAVIDATMKSRVLDSELFLLDAVMAELPGMMS